MDELLYDEPIQLLADVVDVLIDGMWIYLLVSGALMITFMLVVGPMCPECKKRWALKKTGNREKGGWFKADLHEWKCKYCDHRVWGKVRDSGGGGGG